MEPTIYQRIFLTIQIREVFEHKWYSSEKARFDIGIELTLVDWVSRGYAEIFRKKFDAHLPYIERMCQSKCSYNCRGYESCPLTMKDIHQLLED